MAGTSAEVGVVPLAGVSAGAAGVIIVSSAGILSLTEVSAGVVTGVGRVSDHFSITEVLWEVFPWLRERWREVSMKIIAAMQVILLIKVAGPLVPKTEPDDPPRAAPMPAPLPAWSSTVKTSTRAIDMWIMIMNRFMRRATLIFRCGLLINYFNIAYRAKKSNMGIK